MRRAVRQANGEYHVIEGVGDGVLLGVYSCLTCAWSHVRSGVAQPPCQGHKKGKVAKWLKS